MSPSSTTDADAAGGRRDDRRRRRQRLEHEFGRPSTLPASSRTDGTTTTSAAARLRGDVVLRAGCRGRSSRDRQRVPRDARRELVAEVAVAGDAPAGAAGRRLAAVGDGVDQVLESLLAHEPAGREARPCASSSTPQRSRSRRACVRVRPEARRRRRRRARFERSRGSAPSAMARRARSSLQAVTTPARPKARRAAVPATRAARRRRRRSRAG